MKTLIATLRPAAIVFVMLTLLTGVIYPLVVTGVSQAAFADAANGSLVLQDGKVIGSALIGQPFSKLEHFWSRPSATGPMPYNAASSSGSNLGPTNPVLVDAVRARIEALKAADPGNNEPIPVDLVTASASGLDPHISRAGADYQIGRVARARNLPVATVSALVEQHTERALFGVIGESRVNVLRLNLALQSLNRA